MKRIDLNVRVVPNHKYTKTAFTTKDGNAINFKCECGCGYEFQTLLDPAEYVNKQTAKRIEDWLTEDNQLIFHDPTCDKRTKEVAIEWNCDCFLNDIVQRIRSGV